MRCNERLRASRWLLLATPSLPPCQRGCTKEALLFYAHNFAAYLQLGDQRMPTFSACISTLLLLGAALLLQNQLPIWSTLSPQNHCATISAVIIAGTVAFAGWLFVATRWVAAAIVHSVIMAVVGCFCLNHGIGILTDHSIAGGHGPDANSMAGVVYGTGYVAAFTGAVALLCGVLVTRNAFNAPPRKSTVA